MTEGPQGTFTIHYAQDKRENPEGRGCWHQGGSDNDYLADKDGCYTTARKVCSNSLAELLAWAEQENVKIKKCRNCNTAKFPL